MKKELSKETHIRLSNLLGNYNDYLNGKICNYDLLNTIETDFFKNIDTNYLSDYFLIKDFEIFSFYNANIFNNFFKNIQYIHIPIDNLKLIWDSFNKNKIEVNNKNNKNYSYYLDKRYKVLPKFINYLLTNSRKYDLIKLTAFLKELFTCLKEEIPEYNYGRITANAIGTYFKNNNIIDCSFFIFLKNHQNIKDQELGLIIYDFNLQNIYNEEKINLLIDYIIDCKKEKFNITDFINEFIHLGNNLINIEIIKYINKRFSYIYNEKELNQIFDLSTLYNNKNLIKYIIEDIKPEELILKVFYNKFNKTYNFSLEEKEFYFYCIDFLKKRIEKEQFNNILKINQNYKKINNINKI